MVHERYDELLELVDHASLDDIVHFLHAYGDEFSPEDFGSVVCVAAYRGDPDIVRVLLDSGGDPNDVEGINGPSALQCAAESGHVDVARLLIDAGADLGHKTPSGDTALQHTIWSPNIEGRDAVAQLLIERGAYYDIDTAIARADIDRVKELLAEDPQLLAKQRKPTHLLGMTHQAIHKARDSRIIEEPDRDPAEFDEEMGDSVPVQIAQLLVDLGAQATRDHKRSLKRFGVKFPRKS